MCGIAGLLGSSSPGCTRADLALLMSNAIAHRGPDGDGVWSDEAQGIALSHRRLAIVDLSEAGAQPMHAASGRWVVSYNGEIYNAEDIRRDPALAGIAWRGHSDTEVMLESIDRRGLGATLADLNGMYAIALWDRERRELHLVRDRLGIKPLFMARHEGRVLFASELKAIRAVTGRLPIDPSAVASFLRFGYVPAPHAIYAGVEKVMPGEIVTFSADGALLSRRLYWALADAAAAPDFPDSWSDNEATDALEALLGDAVARQMVSDVPIGAFLSGGVDSSAIAALMVKAGKGAVRTFSIGFPEFGFDESAYAAEVASHLGTQHTKLEVDAVMALAVVPALPEMYDEPFADSSQIPTHLVSRLTRKHVTVALSGDGGDELFAGYNRYLLAEGLLGKLGTVPVTVRRALASAVAAVPIGVVDRIAGLLPAGMAPRQAGDKLRKFSEVLPLDADGLYRRLVSQVPNPADFVSAPEYGAASPASPGLTQLERMQYEDTLTYLPDDILQKVDRASMAVALEARPPLLDHRVVEFAWRLPRRMKIRDGATKWLLRQVLYRHVPQRLIDRPKMGFGIPLAEWLRGPLRGWADDLLRGSDFGGGIVDPAPALALWKEHQEGGRNHAYALWCLLSYEAWRQRWARDPA